MATPLKIKDGSGNIQELTTSEENYIAYQIGLHLSEADSSEVGSINKSASGTNIGTFTNTFFNEPVGTHPSTSITSGSTNTSLYQTTGTAAETDSDVYSPLMWVDSASQTGFKMMPDADLNSAIDRYLSTIFTNEYPGSFRLAVSSPGAGWVLDQQAFTDTRTDGTSVTYNIWKKTSGTSPTAVRPMRLKDEGSFEGVQEMSDRQIKYSFGQRAKTRIANSKIGTYQLRSSAQGVPTDPGTWVAKGSATDTKQTTSQQIFTRDSTTAFQTNYTRGYTSTFTLPYLKVYTRVDTAQFNQPYTSTFESPTAYTSTTAVPYNIGYIRSYTPNYTRNYTGTYTGSYSAPGYSPTFEAQYNKEFTARFTANYLKTYTTTYLNQFESNYTSNYTSNYQGTYTNSFNTNYVGTYQSNYTNNYTVTYAGTYDRQYTRGYQSEYTKRYTGTYSTNYLKAYTNNYTGLYTTRYSGGQFTDTYIGNYTNIYSKDYTDNYTKAYTTNYTLQYTQSYTGTYTSNYTLPYTLNYIGTYAGTYSTSFTGNYTKRYTGTYTGEYTGQYNVNVAYASLFNLAYVGQYLKEYTRTVYNNAYDGAIYSSTNYVRDYSNTFLRYYAVGSFAGAYGGSYVGPGASYAGSVLGFGISYQPSYTSIGPGANYTNAYVLGNTGADRGGSLGYIGEVGGTNYVHHGFYNGPITGYAGPLINYTSEGTGTVYINDESGFPAGIRYTGGPSFKQYIQVYSGIGLGANYVGPVYSGINAPGYTTSYLNQYTGETSFGIYLGPVIFGRSYLQNYTGTPNIFYVGPGLFYTGGPALQDIDIGYTQYIKDYGGYSPGDINDFYIGAGTERYTGSFYAADDIGYSANFYTLTFAFNTYLGAGNYATYLGLQSYYQAGENTIYELDRRYTGPDRIYTSANSTGTGAVSYTSTNPVFTSNRRYGTFYPIAYYEGPRDSLYSQTGISYVSQGFVSTYYTTLGATLRYEGVGGLYSSEVSTYSYRTDLRLRYEGPQYGSNILVDYLSATQNIVRSSFGQFQGLQYASESFPYATKLYSDPVPGAPNAASYTNTLSITYVGPGGFYLGPQNTFIGSYTSTTPAGNFSAQYSLNETIYLTAQSESYTGPASFFAGSSRAFFGGFYVAEYTGGLVYTGPGYSGAAIDNYYTNQYISGYISGYSPYSGTGYYTNINIDYVGPVGSYSSLPFFRYTGPGLIYSNDFAGVVPGGVFAGIRYVGGDSYDGNRDVDDYALAYTGPVVNRTEPGLINYIESYAGLTANYIEYYTSEGILQYVILDNTRTYTPNYLRFYTGPRNYSGSQYSGAVAFTPSGGTFFGTNLFEVNTAEYVSATPYATAYVADGTPQFFTSPSGFSIRYIGNYTIDATYISAAFLTYYVAPNYTKNYDVTYLKDYLGSYTGTYITNYTLNFNSNYSTNYTNSYEGQYTDAFNTQYGTTYASVSSLNFDTQYANNYTGGYTGANFETSYVAPQFIGSYQNEFNSTAYNTAYVRNIDAVAYITDYIGAPFVAFYDTTYTSTSSLTYTGSYDRTYTGNRAIAYSNDYANEFVSLYDTTYTKDIYVNAYTNLYERDFQGPSFATSYVGPVYTENYTNTYTSAYEGGSFATSYVKDTYAGTYDASYTNFFVSSYSNQYTEIYTNQYTNQYTSPQYVPNYTGIQETVYDRSYTGGNYDIDYVKSYSKDYTGNYTGSYDITYLGSYQQDYVSFYENQYTTNYTTVYETQYLTDYIGNYEGSFEGTTIDETSDTEETYTLYVRIA